jgi:DNA-binding transcriptional regulator YiaG
MKKSSYDKKLSMILDIAKKSGVILTNLGEELGVSDATVCRWRTGEHTPEDPEEVISTLKNRAKYLSHIDLDKYNIKNLRKDFGITITAIAEELGISQQGLSQQIAQDWPIRDRKKQVQEILRSIGRNLLTVAN